MYWESTFNTNTIRNSSYCEVFTNARTLASDYNTFEHLNTFVGSFNYFYMYANAIARDKFRDIVT